MRTFPLAFFKESSHLLVFPSRLCSLHPTPEKFFALHDLSNPHFSLSMLRVARFPAVLVGFHFVCVTWVALWLDQRPLSFAWFFSSISSTLSVMMEMPSMKDLVLTHSLLTSLCQWATIMLQAIAEMLLWIC